MSRKKILHADDVNRWRDYVRGMLCQKYDVDSVNDCDAVLEKLESRELYKYDLVILDHLMPGFGPDATGFDVCQRIRRDYPRIGVLVYTGAWNDVEVNRKDLEKLMGAPVVFKDGEEPYVDDLVMRASELLV